MRNEKAVKRWFSDWPAKALCLGAALLLWRFYEANRLEERAVSVPLRVSLSDELAAASEFPRSVRLTLRGERNAIASILEEDLDAYADFGSFKGEGVLRAPIRVDRKGSAVGVDPLEIRVEPSDLAISVERKAVKVLPVIPSFRGFLASGYEMASYEILPSEAAVSGPAGAVAKALDAATEVIELSGRKEDFSVRVRLARRDTLLSFEGGETVEFRAMVKLAALSRSFEGLPISVMGLAPNLVCEGLATVGSVTVRGSKAVVDSFVPQEGLLRVDASSATAPGIYELALSAILPPELSLDSIEPSAVVIHLVERPGREGR